MKNNYRSKNDVFKGKLVRRRRRERECKGEWFLLMGSIIDGKGVKYLWSLKFYVARRSSISYFSENLPISSSPPALNNGCGYKGGEVSVPS